MRVLRNAVRRSGELFLRRGQLTNDVTLTLYVTRLINVGVLLSFAVKPARELATLDASCSKKPCYYTEEETRKYFIALQPNSVLYTCEFKDRTPFRCHLLCRSTPSTDGGNVYANLGFSTLFLFSTQEPVHGNGQTDRRTNKQTDEQNA